MEIVAIVIGLTQSVKETELVPKKFLQLVAVLIALVVFAIATYLPEFYAQFSLLLAAILSPKMYNAGKDITGASKISEVTNIGHPVVSPIQKEPRT